MYNYKLNIAITGANGFVGAALFKELALRGYCVKGFTRRLNNHIEHVQYDLTDEINEKTNWDNKLNNMDLVVHLAARVHMMCELADDALAAFLAVNMHGTVRLAKAAASAGVKRFVFVSTIKVNGEYTSVQAFNEADKSNPQDSYAISKYEAEKALRTIEEETGMQVVIIRPPLVYGAGVKANFASLIHLVNKQLPLPLANIKARRSLIYVGNLVDAIITCATHPNAAGKTYLVSDGEDVSMPQLIKKIAFALNKSSCLIPFPVALMRFFAGLMGKRSSFDRLTLSLVIDSTKIRQQLDWKPPFNMQQGLKITAQWYLKSLKNKRT